MENSSKDSNSDMEKEWEVVEKISDPMEVTLLTFDIFLRPPMIHSNKNDHKNTRLSLFLKLLKRYDVINFQEIFRDISRRRRKLIKAGVKEGFKFVSKPKRQPFASKFLRGSGLLTISKYNILSSGFKGYKANKSFVYQGMAYSKILLPNGKIIHLFNTQLQSTEEKKYKSKDKKLYRTRLKQIVQAREIIEYYLDKESNLKEKGAEEFDEIVIITGNFSLNARNCSLPVKDMAFDKLKNDKISSWVEDNKTENPVQDEGVINEYEFLKFVLSGFGQDRVTNVVYESMDQNHPVTYGDCFNKNRKTVPRETVLTSKIGRNSEKCLDYIFTLVPGEKGGLDGKVEYECKVLPFFVDMEDEEEIQNKVTQLSNHYGIRLKFKI